MAKASRDNDDKVAYFQAVTGLQDSSLCAQILEACGWDLDAAVSSMADGFDDPGHHHPPPSLSTEPSPGAAPPSASSPSSSAGFNGGLADTRPPHDTLPLHADPGLAWRIVTLPFSIIRGSYNLMYGAVGLGLWIAGGVLSHSLGAFGWGTEAGREGTDQSGPLLAMSSGAAEATEFVRSLEREYGERHPAFQALSFMDALRRASEGFKFLFVYLHSPEHENTPVFCHGTLCSEAVVQFVNENFMAWGGNVRAAEGFKMSNSLKASTFPFCAVVMASTNQRIALLQQIEGPKTSEELVAILQKVVEEQGTVLVAARIEEEERRLNRRLREEQDAAYQAALRADQERERKKQEETERVVKEIAKAERKRKEEAAAAEQAAREAAERESALERRRQEKAMSLAAEPDKGPNVTEVLLRFPNGVRKERRFFSADTISSVYDYVDSLRFFDAVKYKLVSSFPRVDYGPEKFGISLKDAGLHPRASLYVQEEDA